MSIFIAQISKQIMLVFTKPNLQGQIQCCTTLPDREGLSLFKISICSSDLLLVFVQ